jgi:hypothetical protein
MRFNDGFGIRFWGFLTRQLMALAFPTKKPNALLFSDNEIIISSPGDSWQCFRTQIFGIEDTMIMAFVDTQILIILSRV